MNSFSRLVVVTIAALCATGSPPSHASRIVGSLAHTPNQLPVLAGDRGVVWLEDWRASELVLRKRYFDKASGQLISRLRPEMSSSRSPLPLGSAGIAASATHVAVAATQTSGDRIGEPQTLTRVFGGPLDGQVGQVGECFAAQRPLEKPLQVLGSRLAYPSGSDCRQMRAIDLAGRQPQPTLLSEAPRQYMTSAGPYDAWIERAADGSLTAVVADRGTGAEISRARVSKAAAMALRADGVLAMQGDRTVNLLDRGAQQFRDLDVNGLESPPLAWTDDGLAVVSRDGPLRTQVQIVDTNGARVRQVVSFLTRELRGIADINATHVLWLTRGCKGIDIRSASLRKSQATVLAKKPCRLNLTSSPRVVRRGLRLNVSCAGFRFNCDASVSVRSQGRVIARGRTGQGQETRRGATATLRLSSAARQRLRAQKRPRITVTATFSVERVTRSVTTTIR